MARFKNAQDVPLDVWLTAEPYDWVCVVRDYEGLKAKRTACADAIRKAFGWEAKLHFLQLKEEAIRVKTKSVLPDDKVLVLAEMETGGWIGLCYGQLSGEPQNAKPLSDMEKQQAQGLINWINN